MLTDGGVRYVVIGGLAATIHGSPLLTRDVDITPSTDRGNLERLAAALRQLGAQLRVPDLDVGVPVEIDARWLSRMTSMTFVTSMGLLDVVVRPEGIPDVSALFARAEPVEVDGTVITVAALDDIIRSKEAAARPKDIATLPVLHELARQIAARDRRSPGEADGGR